MSSEQASFLNTEQLPPRERPSLVSHLECPVCGAVYDAAAVQTYCGAAGCASPLYTRYHILQGISPSDLLRDGDQSLWRYRAMLPVMADTNIVTLGEGGTPLLPLTGLKLAGDTEVWWKDESGNPTGSFKSRGMSLAVSKAKELGITDMVTPTAGNAGGALAAYCARAGMQAHVFMPRLTPKLFKDEVRFYGATLTEVDGNIADCGRLAEAMAADKGWFSAATLKEPYRLEGKKTMGYEIAEQCGWQLPDVILYPTGGGTGLLGIWKAFDEMEALGWIGAARPRMVCVQSECCDGLTTAFHLHEERATYADNGYTIANGLRVPKPFADRMILRVLNESGGTAISISDEAMKAAMKEIARKEGMLVAPEGAALWSAANTLQAAGWLRSGERVLLLNTGSGYKYLENVIN